MGPLQFKRAQWQGLFFGACWFIACWLPVSGLVYVGTSFTADRYIYLGLAGPLVFLVRGAGQFPRKAMIGLGVVVALFWSGLCWMQVGTWKNGWSLFRHTTEARPGLTTGWVNLGGMYQSAGRFREAEESYKQAIALDALDYAAWFNLGNTQKEAKRISEARQSYKRAIEIYPDHLPSLLNLGLLAMEEGRFEEARDLFQIGADRDIRMLWLTCECEFRLGNIEKGRALLERLERENVRNPAVRRGMTLARTLLDQREK